MIVVSGLPRSGTSMMMQVLKDNGYDVPNSRPADENNPQGYYELSPRSAVKCVYPIVEKTEYIVMLRNIDAICDSMEKMLGRKVDRIPWAKKQKEMLAFFKDKNVRYIQYEDVLKDPSILGYKNTKAVKCGGEKRIA